jgi:hypothetical protein
MNSVPPKYAAIKMGGVAVNSAVVAGDGGFVGCECCLGATVDVEGGIPGDAQADNKVTIANRKTVVRRDRINPSHSFRKKASV